MNYTKLMEATTEERSTVHPKPKTPQEIQEDPKELLKPEVVKEMAADEEITKTSEEMHNLEMSPEQAKSIWESVTKGETHKHSACVNAMQSKVKDAHAYCQALGEKVGYKPEHMARLAADNSGAYDYIESTHFQWGRRDSTHVYVWTPGYKTSDAHELERALMKFKWRLVEQEFDKMCGKTINVFKHP